MTKNLRLLAALPFIGAAWGCTIQSTSNRPADPPPPAPAGPPPAVPSPAAVEAPAPPAAAAPAPTPAPADDPPAASLPPPADAGPNWVYLGGKEVDFRMDKDSIRVGGADGTFSAIEFRVIGSAMVMRDIRVIFGNDEAFSPETRLEFNAGTTSRRIDLPGAKRRIKRIEFVYKSLDASTGKAAVRVGGIP